MYHMIFLDALYDLLNAIIGWACVVRALDYMLLENVFPCFVLWMVAGCFIHRESNMFLSPALSVCPTCVCVFNVQLSLVKDFCLHSPAAAAAAPLRCNNEGQLYWYHRHEEYLLSFRSMKASERVQIVKHCNIHILFGGSWALQHVGCSNVTSLMLC